MRLLILGAAGFVGHHLVRWAAADGHDVLAVDRVRSDVGVVNGVPYMRADLADPAGWSSELLSEVDVVVNLAAESFVHDSHLRLEQQFSSNVLTAKNLGDALRNSLHKPKLVHFSTCEVYGDTMSGPANEQVAFSPVSVYAGTKAAGETLLRSYATAFDVPLVIIRPFNVYGDGQQPNRLIPTAIAALRNGWPVPALQDSDRTRDWHHVDDLVALSKIAIESPDIAAAGDVQVFNSCSGASRSVLDVVRATSELLDLPYRLERSPTADATPQIRRSEGSNSRALQQLGWMPKISFRDGLRRTIEGT